MYGIDCKTGKIIRIIALLLTAVMLLMLAGCGSASETGSSSAEEHKTGSMELAYASQFHVDYYDDGISMLSVEDGLEYIIVPDREKLPDWLDGSVMQDKTIIEAPAKSVYMAASSGMDLVNAIGGIDSVAMTSTQASDWAIDEIRERVDDGSILYIGKYRAPDFEALVEGDIDLAVESTMIYHNPDVKEAIEELGIPVLVERSSYENDPLGRLEWIKLYGLLLGKEAEAEAFFDESVEKIQEVDTGSIKEKPLVTFFSVNSNGSVIVRKPGDYVTKMIETAGGEYALDGITEEEDNALSTMNMQMEAFYDMAVDADILIYNSAIEADLTEISDLTALSEQFADFKAVKEGNVWCTNKSVFQKVTGAAGMISEMNQIFSGASDDSGMEYFHTLK